MSTILTVAHVDLTVEAADRDHGLARIASLATRLGVTNDESGVYAELVRREAEGTTGLFDGIAIPHAKHASIVRPVILVAGFTTPISWESLDGAPITVAIALMIPEAEAGTSHLRLLSKVAQTLIDDDVRQQLLAATGPERVVELLSKDLGLDD